MTTRTHPAITVLVYGNPVSSETRNADDVGDVFLDLPPEKVRRHNPAPGLNLLDVSDFRVSATTTHPLPTLPNSPRSHRILHEMNLGALMKNTPRAQDATTPSWDL